MAAELKLLHGNADLIAALEHALVEAKAGRLVGVVICGITAEGCGWTGAVNDDIAFPWPRLQAAVDTAQQELVTEGVAGWN